MARGKSKVNNTRRMNKGNWLRLAGGCDSMMLGEGFMENVSSNSRAEYERWLASETICDDIRKELVGIGKDEGLITDRFWKNLSFGTGGIRGRIGAGTNRINTVVVRRVTQGLADYIKSKGGDSACIAYDTRNFSRVFAETCAEVLCANGLKAYLFSDVRPTPMLSFAVIEKKASAGIVITASHNPSEYNGYKVYGADGGQVTDKAANEISDNIRKHDILAKFPQIKMEEARKKGLLFDLDDVDARYYEQVKSLVVRNDVISKNASDLNVLFTPLHGAGNIPVRRVLCDLGFNVEVVKEQELPDGDFPTVLKPNPEDADAFKLALNEAKSKKYDIIIATDPDADRIGVQTLGDSGEYKALNGNEIGILLSDYLVTAKKQGGKLAKNTAIVKTIVTTELVRKICDDNGVACIETLTGFKYIGEKITEWEKTGEYEFLLGFEESYGYLAGTFVRDKDAIIAAALVCEMALYYKLKKLSLHQALENLFSKYGYSGEKLLTVITEGVDGMEKINGIMKTFREQPESLFNKDSIASFQDYKDGFDGLPKSNVVKIIFADNSWLAVRPSGTEPQIKFYFGARGDNSEQVKARLIEFETSMREKFA